MSSGARCLKGDQSTGARCPRGEVSKLQGGDMSTGAKCLGANNYLYQCMYTHSQILHI